MDARSGVSGGVRRDGAADPKLVDAVLWMFAIAIAYPFLPGSDSDAFKGVSVFIGLMISLGSSGLVNQVTADSR